MTAPTATPESDKLNAAAAERTAILDFLEWCTAQGIRLVSTQAVTDTIDVSGWFSTEPQMKDVDVEVELPHPAQGQNLVHQYLGIDDNALDRERRAILDAFRKAH